MHTRTDTHVRTTPIAAIRARANNKASDRSREQVNQDALKHDNNHTPMPDNTNEHARTQNH
eukprot:15469897-Alexandrium_andersonii.AAC.1